jgi:pimeloyl-ACP methyl ester carboxylesterase
LLSLAAGHPALGRAGRLVLTNCDNYDQFPPDALRKGAALARTLPRLARALLRLQLRSSIGRRKIVSGVAASGLDHEREESFFGPARRDQQVVDDLVAALASFRPQLLIDAAEAIPRFDRPVVLIWGESCDFFPMRDAQRLASEFLCATLVSVPEAKTWVPIDSPVAVADAIGKFVPTPVS